MSVHPIEKRSAALVKMLKHTMADTFVLYLKTWNYHWHVKGPAFYTYHAMFETQYTELAAAVDSIGERLVQLHEQAPGTLQSIASNSCIKESEKIPNPQTMIKNLIEGHCIIAEECKKGIASANKISDEATADLLTQRLAHHEKTIWMLQSSLG